MRKKYEKVELVVVVLDEDVITTSGDGQKVFDEDNVVSWFGVEGGK